MRSIPAQIKSYAPGFALALIIALLAKGIEALLPFDVIGASVIAMFIGMLINGYRKPGKTTAPGVKFTAKASAAAAPSRRSHPSSTPRTAISPTLSPPPSSLIWR